MESCPAPYFVDYVCGTSDRSHIHSLLIRTLPSILCGAPCWISRFCNHCQSQSLYVYDRPGFVVAFEGKYYKGSVVQADWKTEHEGPTRLHMYTP